PLIAELIVIEVDACGANERFPAMVNVPLGAMAIVLPAARLTLPPINKVPTPPAPANVTVTGEELVNAVVPVNERVAPPSRLISEFEPIVIVPSNVDVVAPPTCNAPFVFVPLPLRVMASAP